MAPRHSLATLVLRMGALALVALAATTSATSASSGKVSPPPQAQDGAKAHGRAASRQRRLLVPDLHGQPYVFAKGILDDAGFSWHVRGSVQGFPGNIVESQWPPAGTRVLDTGSPRVVLRLRRASDYRERGIPINTSRQRPTPVVVAPPR